MDEPSSHELKSERYRMALEAILKMYEKGDKAHIIARDALHGKLARDAKH